MSFTEVLSELPGLTVQERQVLISKALELDDLSLAPFEEVLIEKRLAEHAQDPSTSLSLAELKQRLDSRSS